jgi:hypothetical protein
MMHPSTELKFISEDKGYGVVATEFIPRGTITWVKDKLDRVISPNEIDDLGNLYSSIIDTYAYRDKKGDFILCWDHGRFINHSFNSNCLTTAYDFEIAIRDILEGEELTDDYGYLNISEPFKGINEGGERTMVFPDDLLKYHQVWDEKIDCAMKHFKYVEQLLIPFLHQNVKNKLSNFLNGQEEMDSILTCYFEPNK